MKTIFLDVDGVLADFARGFRRLFKKALRGAEWEVTDAQWKTIAATKNFWLDLLPLNGALTLARLSPLPSNFFLLTSRSGSETKKQTLRWLAMHSIAIEDEHVLFTDRPGKIDTLRSFTPGVAFLDDSVLNTGMAAKCKDVDSFLMKQSYNKAVAREFPALRVVATIEEFLQLIS